jgi:hypothetical protein
MFGSISIRTAAITVPTMIVRMVSIADVTVAIHRMHRNSDGCHNATAENCDQYSE